MRFKKYSSRRVIKFNVVLLELINMVSKSEFIHEADRGLLVSIGSSSLDHCV